MSRALMWWDGRLVEVAAFNFFENCNVVKPIPNQCPTCSGMGSTLEQIDRDRLPEAVRCWRCKGEGVLRT
jgi:DnaJ-class molecular chaperone